MLTLPVLRLKKGRERPARAGHPWLFSGAFEAVPPLEPGSLCRVEDADGRFVAIGYANPERSLTVRVLAWDDVDDLGALLRTRIRAAVELRRSCMPPDTDAYRVVCSEGDTQMIAAADAAVTVPNGIDELLSPLVYAVPVQLLAYHVAVMRGCNVDMPRNLAKSVTVE